MVNNEYNRVLFSFKVYVSNKLIAVTMETASFVALCSSRSLGKQNSMYDLWPDIDCL